VSQTINRPSSAQSTRPSSSASNNSELSGGVALGGEKGRDSSNLLNLSTNETPKSTQDDLINVNL
jgi:hypothetical protein